MGKATHIMIHCADTPEGMDVTGDHIRQWHIEERGWSRVGYHHLIRLSGMIEDLIEYDEDDIIEPWEISNGAKGWNGKVLPHICYAGGNGNVDTRTARQQTAMLDLILQAIKRNPKIKVIGHNQVNAHKYCPSFDVPSWCLNMGIPEENIDFNIYH